MNLREKIASVLSYLYTSFGVNNQGELPEYFTRDDIASLACTTSEQVSRQLTDFQKEKIIEKRTRKIAILKPAALKSIISDYLIMLKPATL
jgi:CRP-like cAMP-binding protein